MSGPTDGNVSKTRRKGSVEARLFDEGYSFDFFQAVRLLERLDSGRRPVGRESPPSVEAVRFKTHLSLSFPPSSIYELDPPSSTCPAPAMTVTFLGLTGAAGVLPRHYTELLMRQQDSKDPEKGALRAWFDLFNHRAISLFYRAWEKYRFHIPYERGEYALPEPDAFTRALLSLVGTGLASLRNRLRISTSSDDSVDEAELYRGRRAGQRELVRVDDLILIFYGGHFSRRLRSATALSAIVEDYFQLPAHIQQFKGQWFQLERASQSTLGSSNSDLGLNAVAGDRVWDVQSKFRVRLGPLRYNQFTEFLPDRAPEPDRKAFFLLAHLVRMYVGPEFDFDIQLVLRASDVPSSQLRDGADGPRLGWNTWIHTDPMEHDAEDACFESEEVTFLHQAGTAVAQAG